MKLSVCDDDDDDDDDDDYYYYYYYYIIIIAYDNTLSARFIGPLNLLKDTSMVPFVYYLWYIFELIFYSTCLLTYFLNNDNNGLRFHCRS